MSDTKVKISVLRVFDPKEVFETSPVKRSSPMSPCERHHEGQEFIVNLDMEMPEGFCPQAWHDLFRKIGALHWGGGYTTTEGPDYMIACCTDGTRPVSFKLERL